MPVYAIEGIIPVVHPEAYVHPAAILIGDVIIGPRCYVGPAASLRGDFGRLILEEGANLQDTCVMHGYPGTDTVVEVDGHIGHGAVLHGCRVGKNAMVGMNAVIMDNALIGESSIVAAMALVKANVSFPPRSLIAGVPAKLIRKLSDEEIEWKRQGTATYQQLTLRSLASLEETTPLRAVEPNRKRIQVADIEPLYKIRR
jgi:phenylacetic acid degradation protein